MVLTALPKNKGRIVRKLTKCHPWFKFDKNYSFPKLWKEDSIKQMYLKFCHERTQRMLQVGIQSWPKPQGFRFDTFALFYIDEYVWFKLTIIFDTNRALHNVNPYI